MLAWKLILLESVGENGKARLRVGPHQVWSSVHA